jgi:hypothetical protein
MLLLALTKPAQRQYFEGDLQAVEQRVDDVNNLHQTTQREMRTVSCVQKQWQVVEKGIRTVVGTHAHAHKKCVSKNTEKCKRDSTQE